MQSFALKLIMVGDSNVGKSQLSRSFMEKGFMEKSQSTVGIEFATREIDFEKCVIKSQVWDTAGQERFAKMTKAYYKNSVAALLVYDICKASSFENLKTTWFSELRNYSTPNIRLMLVGNKTDLLQSGRGQRQVSISDGMAFAKEHGFDFMETSALSGEHVEICFRRVLLSVAKKLPDISMQLELSFLPEGWMVCTRPLTPKEEADIVNKQQRSATIAITSQQKVEEQIKEKDLPTEEQNNNAASTERQTSVGIPSTTSGSLTTVGGRSMTIGSPSESSVATANIYSSGAVAVSPTPAIGSDPILKCSSDSPQSSLKSSRSMKAASGKGSRKTLSALDPLDESRFPRMERVESDRLYINYWTGELVHLLPLAPAIIPGLLYDADHADEVLRSLSGGGEGDKDSSVQDQLAKQGSRETVEDNDSPVTERASGSSSGKTVNLHRSSTHESQKRSFKCYSCVIN